MENLKPKKRVRTRSFVKHGKNFTGYKPGYDPKTGAKIPPYKLHILNIDRYAKMIKESGSARPTVSSGLRAHRDATEKLQALNFDPIVKLVEELEDVEELLAKELSLDNPRSTYVNNLITCKLRILDILVPYRYGKAPVLTVESTDANEPIQIHLTGIGENNDSSGATKTESRETDEG